MQVVLVMFKADGARRSFPLSRDVTIIGRREDCDLRIPLTEVSRKHCRLIKDNNGLRLEDLGSSNGTYHNGTRVQESVIQPGDQIQIGPVGFTVQIDGFPTDDMIHPPQVAHAGDSGDSVVDDSAAATMESPRPAMASRPRAPEGEDLRIGAEGTAEDDEMDLGPILSPPDDDDLTRK